MNPALRKTITVVLIFLILFLSVRYIIPLVLPLLLGALLALSAEPLVRFLCRKVRIPRAAAAGIGIFMAFSFLGLTIMLVCSLMLRELRSLSGVLPQLEDATRSGLDSLAGWLVWMARKAPRSLQPALIQKIRHFFSSGSALLEKATEYLLGLASGLISQVPDSALGFGTGILASFMISAKLPSLREAVRRRIPASLLAFLPGMLCRVRSTFGSWIKAQLKLSAVNYLVLTLGFLLLGISYAPLWGLLVAAVDAFPILGTGTVLIPWSLISFLQGQRLRAFSLLGIYAAVTLIRTVLEPKLVSRQLEMDPLITLAAMYAGYKLWGLGGLILAPMVTALLLQMADFIPPKKPDFPN